MRLGVSNAKLVFQQGTPYKTTALADVSLEVEPGERLGISGPVGSGKSTLLAVLAGMIVPDSGTVHHDGRVLDRKDPPEPGSVGLSFQAPETCLFARTVFEDVSFAPRRLGLDEAECKRRTEAALESVGLVPAHFAGRSPFSLSAGEQRRVALAGVLAMEPRALLLDEPTANLDPASRRDITARLVEFNREMGTTMVVVGHDMDDMARFAERVVIIEDGRKAEEGTARRLLRDAGLLARYGLVPPGTVELGLAVSKKLGEDAGFPLSEPAALDMLLKIRQRRRGEGER